MDKRVTCWPISRAIGSDLQKKIKLFFVFNGGKSAILVTVDNDVFAVGTNPYGALGNGTQANQLSTMPIKVEGVTAG